MKFSRKRRKFLKRYQEERLLTSPVILVRLLRRTNHELPYSYKLEHFIYLKSVFVTLRSSIVSVEQNLKLKKEDEE